MPARHVVVDGSNIATEGRSLPSLKQLDEAVREFLIENPDDVVTVVVDATFGHRISPDERDLFEEAEGGGEIVSPPAGAIGRGDAFLLRVADKVGAVVLSNDSFQEFHGEYEWLFDKGRLIGGKPVPGVGWIFTPRTPVRGPKSRESVKEAKRKRHAERADEVQESGLDMAAERSRGHGGERKLQRAIAAAVEEAVEPAKGGRKRRRRRRGSEALSEPLNEPLKFITFIAANQLGDEVEGTVEEFSSHGAFVSVDGARCYLPLSAMGKVPPRSAREVLRKGERRAFVVQAFDAMRRGIELALPGFAHLAGGPTAETIDAEIHRGEADGEAAAVEAGPAGQGEAELLPAAPNTVQRAPAVPVLTLAEQAQPPEPPPPVQKSAAKAAAARKRAVAARRPGPEGPALAVTTAQTSKRPSAKKPPAAKKPAPRADKAISKVAAKSAPPTGKPAMAGVTKAKTAPAKTVPAKTVPAKTVPTKTVPAKTVPAKAMPTKAVPTKALPAKTGEAKGATGKAAVGEGVVGGTSVRQQGAGKKAPSKGAAAKEAAGKEAPKKEVPAKGVTGKQVAGKQVAGNDVTGKEVTGKTAAPRKSPAKRLPARQVALAQPPEASAEVGAAKRPAVTARGAAKKSADVAPRAKRSTEAASPLVKKSDGATSPAAESAAKRPASRRKSGGERSATAAKSAQPSVFVGD